jgi:hypothetical protein
MQFTIAILISAFTLHQPVSAFAQKEPDLITDQQSDTIINAPLINYLLKTLQPGSRIILTS